MIWTWEWGVYWSRCLLGVSVDRWRGALVVNAYLGPLVIGAGFVRQQ